MDSVNRMPAEVDLTGVYFVPLLVNFGLAVILTFVTAYLLNRYRLSRFFFYPPLVFLALSVIYTGLIGKLLIPV